MFVVCGELTVIGFVVVSWVPNGDEETGLVVPKMVEGTEDGVGDGFAKILDGDDTGFVSSATGLQTFKFEKSVSVESV